MAASRSRAGRIGLWLSRLILALLLIVCTTLVAVFSFEEYSLQPLAERLVERFTGRTLSIDGSVDARAGRIVSIRAERIRLSNADWGSSEDLLSIDEAEISVDLLDLLGGTMAADRLVVNGVRLLFEEDEQGRSNWAMGSDDNQSEPESESEPESDTEDRSPRALPVVHSQLSNIDITVINAALERPLKLHLDSVGHSADQGNELRVTVVGAVRNRSLNLQASIGPITQLLDAGAVDFDIKADFEAIALEVNGHLDKLLAPRQASVHVSLVSAEISQVFTTLGLPQVASGATELKASMLPADDHHKLVLATSIDTLQLDVEVHLPALHTIDGTSVAVSAQGPDLAAAARLAGLDGLPSQPFDFKSSVALAGKQLTIGETNFDSGDSHFTARGTMSQFPSLEGTNLNLQLVGKNYLEFAELLGITDVAELQPEPFEIHTDLEYDAQDQQKISGKLQFADVSGVFSGELTGYPALVGSHLEYRLDGRNDALIQRLLGRPTQIEGTYTLEGNLERVSTGFGIERATLSIDANELEISGTIGEDPLRGDTDLSMRFHGPDLNKIVAVAGYTGFLPGGTAEINAAARTQDNAIHVDDLTAQLGRNSLKASGLLSLQTGLAGSRVKIALAGEDIAEILPPELLAYVDPQQSFELSGSLATDTGQLAISGLQARLGEVTLEATGNVSTQQPLTDMALKVDARGPDLAAIIPEDLVPYSLPAAEFSVSGGVALTENGLELDGVDALIGPDRLELSGTIPLDNPTEGLNLVIAASGPDLGKIIPLENEQPLLKGQAYELNGHLELARELISLHKLDFSTPRGRLSGELSVSLLNPLQFGQFDLEANGDNLSEFIPSTPAYSLAAVPFDLDARGSWDSEKVSIEKGVLELDDSKIEVQGEVNLPPNVAATRLVLSAEGDSLADLGQFKGLVLPPDEFHIDATLLGDADGLKIPELEALIGESDMRGALQIKFAEKPTIRIKLESDLIDLETLIPPGDDPPEVETPAEPLASDGRVIPQTPVRAEQLHSVNLETEIRIGELRVFKRKLQDIEFNSLLQESNLTVSQFKATATEGTIIAQFEAVAEGDRITANGRLEGKEFVLMNPDEGTGGSSLPRIDLGLVFETNGTTVREMAANLNGLAKLTGGSGRLQNSYTLGLFGSFFSELFRTVNPFSTREPYTTISCFGAYAEITDGVARINPGAVMQTDKLDVGTIGEIDLNTERIQLRIDTRARSGLGISVADFVNPFVGISGTLAKPRLGVDPKNAMFEGGFAVATGGLSIVAKSLYSRWYGEKDPCARLEKSAQKLIQEKQEAKEEQPAEDVKSAPVDQ